MKKVLIIVALLLFRMGDGFAQQYVSTESSLRNAIIEEITGRTCPGCPAAHQIGNRLKRTYPGRVFVVNLHHLVATYPNLSTQEGGIILHKISGSIYPSAQINRSQSSSVPPVSWEPEVLEVIKQVAPCNIDGFVLIDETSRIATITTEVYYTHDSDADINYLTIAMSQDSIWGSQNNGFDNPEQYVDGNYCHMDVFRDIITPTWGAEISPTTEGTLITRTYTYIVPEIIGDPNGVEVNVNHLEFLAFVSNNMNDGMSRPILNVSRLPLLVGTQESLFPYIDNIKDKQKDICSDVKTFTVCMMNRGLDEITSIKMLMEVDNGDTFEYEWNGSIASYNMENIEFDMEVPVGIHDIDFKIVEVNGVPFDSSKTITSVCEEKNIVFVENENDEVVIELMQDKFGNEITWQIVDEENAVIASGGPYEHIFGPTTATLLHEIKLNLPINKCLRFVITDMMKNGICCDYGDGYYRIINGHGNVAIEGDGRFGESASHVFTLEVGENVIEIEPTAFEIYPNPARDLIKLSSVICQPSVLRIYNCLGILVEEFEMLSEEIEINVSDYNAGMYFISIQDDKGKIHTGKLSVIK